MAPIQILNKRLFIPASSYTRDLRFVVDSTSKHPPRAMFKLSASSKFDLPVVILDFPLNADDWENYDPAEHDNELMTDTSSFLKGAYAAKEQAFSVPIRSGLDWRRSVYVTCW